MKKSNFNWNDLRYIIAISRNNTIVEAARHLGVDATTVSRRISAAEETLGAKLFDRAEGKLFPTEIGRITLRYAEHAESEIESLVDSIRDSDSMPAGTVRVTAVPILVGRLLVPAAKKLLEQYPNLNLEIVAEPRDLSLVQREIDIALRLARPKLTAGRAVITRKIGTLPYAVYVPEKCPPGSENELPWIGYEDKMRDLPQAKWMAETSLNYGYSNIWLNDAECVLQSICAGFGRSLLPCVIGDKIEGIRKSQPPEAASPLPRRDVWLLVHPGIRMQKKVSVVIEWMEKTLAFELNNF